MAKAKKAKDKKAKEKGSQAASIAAPSAGTDDDSLASLQQSLEDMQRQLLGIDPTSLSDDEHEIWRRQVNSISLAITKVRNARLAELSAEIAAELPALRSATDELAASLAGLEAANEIIDTIADGIGVVTQILTLFA